MANFTEAMFDETNAFCISIFGRGDARWEKMVGRFDRLGFRATRWSAATEGRDRFHGALSPGERGCAQSHIDLWRHIVQQNIPYALIMEDDACFDWDWRARLSELGGGEGLGSLGGGGGGGEIDLILLNASEPMDTLFQWSNVTEQYLTGAYIITLRGAQRILDMFSSSQFYAADWMTTRFQLAFRSTVSYFPWIVIQDGEDSMIRSDISADRAKVLRCLRACGYLLTHYCI